MNTLVIVGIVILIIILIAGGAFFFFVLQENGETGGLGPPTTIGNGIPSPPREIPPPPPVNGGTTTATGASRPPDDDDEIATTTGATRPPDDDDDEIATAVGARRPNGDTMEEPQEERRTPVVSGSGVFVRDPTQDEPIVLTPPEDNGTVQGATGVARVVPTENGDTAQIITDRGVIGTIRLAPAQGTILTPPAETDRQVNEFGTVINLLGERFSATNINRNHLLPRIRRSLI